MSIETMNENHDTRKPRRVRLRVVRQQWTQLLVVGLLAANERHQRKAAAGPWHDRLREMLTSLRDEQLYEVARLVERDFRVQSGAWRVRVVERLVRRRRFAELLAAALGDQGHMRHLQPREASS